jgi:hypothetical protein
MEVSQHARYTCTFCGKVRLYVLVNQADSLMNDCPSGLREEVGCRYLGLLILQEGHCWRSMDCVNDCCCHSAEVSIRLILMTVQSNCLSFSTVRRLRELTEA